MIKRLLVVFVILGCVSASPLVANSPLPMEPSNSVTHPPGLGPNASGTGPETMTDIIDIKDNVSMGYNPWIIYGIIIMVAVMLVVGLIFYIVDRYIKKRHPKTQDHDTCLPPEVLAKHDLLALETLGYHDARLFYFTLTAIVKTYLEGRFAVGAPEMTTEELLPKLTGISMENDLIQHVKDLLRRSDPVKFAGLDETKETMVRDMDFVKTWIEKTTPDETINVMSRPETDT